MTLLALARNAVLAFAPALAAQAAFASLCETGRRQSPIDITAAQKRDLPPLQFNYRAQPLVLANDGHTLRVRLPRGGELRVGSQRYRLYQFHFHTPGGDRIAGEEFPMVAHLLHKSDSGQLLAVSVPFRLGSEQPALAPLLAHMPPRPDADHRIANASVDPSALLPAQRGYFRYTGSLTSAPCTEGVEWIVMREPIRLSAAQLAQYRSRFADNARAAQPLNGRVVLESP